MGPVDTTKPEAYLALLNAFNKSPARQLALGVSHATLRFADSFEPQAGFSMPLSRHRVAALHSNSSRPIRIHKSQPGRIRSLRPPLSRLPDVELPNRSRQLSGNQFQRSRGRFWPG